MPKSVPFGGTKMDVKHLKTVAKKEIGGESFVLELKEFKTKDGTPGNFLSLVRGKEQKEGDQTFFQVSKRYTIPLKAKKWLSEVLATDF